MQQENTARFSVDLPQEIHREVQAIADKHELSVAWVVCCMVSDLLKNKRQIILTERGE